MIDMLLFPFHVPFLVRGMIITVLVALPMALLSCFVILKGWSLLGDAMSHAVFPGVVLGYMVSPWVTNLAFMLGWTWVLAISPKDITMLCMAIGAFLAGMCCALLTGYISGNSRVKRDTIMGIIFSSMFGLGLIMATSVRSELHLTHILFGNLLGVNRLDILHTAIIGTVIMLFLIIKWRDLMLFTFDEVQAYALGLRVRVLYYMLLSFIALTIVAALKAVGIVLSISLLIAPGAIAYLLTKRFSMMLFIAACSAVLSSVLGIYLSLYLGSDSGATVVLLMTLIFIGAFYFRRACDRAASIKNTPA